MADYNEIVSKLDLPPVPKPKGVYKPALIDGNHLYVSGHGPIKSDGSTVKGCVGSQLDADQAKQAARQTGLAILATLKDQLGDLNRVKRVIRVLGMVYSTPDFDRQPYVINGCSELFAEVFGPDNGVGTRSAAGMGSLPGQMPVEIEALFELQ